LYEYCQIKRNLQTNSSISTELKHKQLKKHSTYKQQLKQELNQAKHDSMVVVKNWLWLRSAYVLKTAQ